MKKKTPAEERAIIVGQPNKRPYGAKVRIHLDGGGAIGNVENVSVPLSTGAFLTITPARTAPWEGGKKFIVTLEGFPTAAAAEAAGRRLIQALLWMSISTNFPLRFEYQSYEPAAVYERNRSIGLRMEAFGELGCAPELALGELHDAYISLETPDEKLLLSMEIFCAARMESSQRAVFLSVVSALEPLASEASYGEPVNAFVTSCVAQLRKSQEIPSEIRQSIEGRLLQLRQESIRQALKRVVGEILPDDPEAVDIIDDAYNLRSQIIHSGAPADLDIDLEREVNLVSSVIRKIYARRLKRKVVVRHR